MEPYVCIVPVACVAGNAVGADVSNATMVGESDLSGRVGYGVDADCSMELSDADDVIGAVVAYMAFVLEDDKGVETTVLVTVLVTTPWSRSLPAMMGKASRENLVRVVSQHPSF